MTRRPTDHELLGFIEHSLSRDDFDRVERALAEIEREEPGLTAHLKSMRDDRTRLQELPEPAWPGDLVAELELQLARPMLMSDPEEFRRRHLPRPRWPRYAAAAGIMLLLGGTTTALWMGGMFESATQSFGMASSDTSTELHAGAGTPSLGDATNQHSVSSGTAFDGPVHHWSSSLSPSELRAIVSARQLRDSERQQAQATESRDPQQRLSEYALVIHAPRERAALDRVRDLVFEARTAALVRNFTYQEAATAWREMVAQADLPQRDQLLSSLSQTQNGRMDAWQKETIRRVAGATRHTLGEQLAGQRAHAPDPSIQLQLGEQGVRYSLALPVADIIDFLQSLETGEAGELMLMSLKNGRLEGDLRQRPTTADAWRDWNDAIRVLRAMIADSVDGDVVVLPVVIHAAQP